MELQDQTQTVERAKKILKTFKKDDIFVDVGAYHGLFTLLPHKGQTIAFEPSEKAYKKLNAIIKNKGIKNITLHNKAIHSAEHHYDMKVYPFEASNQVLVNPSGKHQAVVLNKFFSKEEQKRIKLVKMDVKYEEQAAFEGMQELVTNYLPALIIDKAQSEHIFKSFAKINNYTFELLEHNCIMLQK